MFYTSKMFHDKLLKCSLNIPLEIYLEIMPKICFEHMQFTIKWVTALGILCKELALDKIYK